MAKVSELNIGDIVRCVYPRTGEPCEGKVVKKADISGPKAQQPKYVAIVEAGIKVLERTFKVKFELDNTKDYEVIN
jgi:hypothetical protein